jgi:hypothetical protein
VASFNVEASIRRRGSSFNEHLDYKHAASVNISQGRAVNGLFHTPHTWRMKSLERHETDDAPADAVVKQAE